jgi:AAA domain
MRVGISGTYSSGKTLTAMALAHLTGIPRTRARTMREILPLAAPGKRLEECTAAELVQMIVVRHVDRAVHEARLGQSFVSDGTSLQEWIYGAVRVHVGIDPNTSAGRDPSDAVPRTPELEFFGHVMEQIGMAVKRHVAASFDGVAHLVNELPLAADGHRPVNETFRTMSDEQLRATLRQLGMRYVLVGGSLPHRLEEIATAFGLRPLLDVDEAVRRARAEYAALDVRLETLRVQTRGR